MEIQTQEATQGLEVRTRFRIPEMNQSRFLAKMVKLAKSAKKLGVEAPVATLISSKVESHIIGNFMCESGNPERINILVHEYEVTGMAPKMAGWSFIATIQPTEAGNLVRGVPGHEVDVSWQTAHMTCQHCNKNRKRSEYFLVQNETGVKSVGRQCLKDFLGHANPAAIASMMECIGSLSGDEGMDEGMSAGSARMFHYSTAKDVAEWTLAVVAKDGWVPKSYDPDRNTANTVSYLMTNPYSDRDGTRKWQKDCEEYAAFIKADKVEAALAWIANLETKEFRSNFEHNLLLCLKLDRISHKEKGLFVAGIAIAAKAIDADIAARKTAAEKSNEYVGVVGERGTFSLICIKAQTMQTDFGTSTLVLFEDEKGNVIKWFASGEQDFNVGDTYQVTGRVKKHEEYKGRRQTALTRCKVEHVKAS